MDGEITEVGNAADYDDGDDWGDGNFGGYKLFSRNKRIPADDDPNGLEGVLLWVWPET